MKSKKTKILTALILSIFCLSSGLACYANVGTDVPYTGVSEWFGMPLTSVKVDYQFLPSGDTDIAWVDRLAYPADISYTHAYSPVPLPYGAGQEFSESYESLYLEAPNGDLIYEFEIQDSVIFSQTTNAWRYVTGLDIHSDDTWSTNVTFSFAPFYFNSATMTRDDFLHIVPTVMYRTASEMGVRYEYDIMTLEYFPTLGEWERSEVSHVGEWDFINTEEANDPEAICFMPPTLVDYASTASNREKRAVITNLQVTILDFQATKTPTGSSFMPNVCYYDFCDSEGHQNMIKLDYTDGGVNILDSMETAGFFTDTTETPGMFSWMLDSLDAFVSFEIAPGFSLGAILGVLLGIGLLMLLLKLVAGG